MQKFVTQSQELVLPGIDMYLRSESGKQFLQNTSKDNICFIKLDSPDNPEWIEARKVSNIILHINASSVSSLVILESVYFTQKNLSQIKQN